MSLWNFCHPFPVFYDWNTSTNDRIRFFRVFSRNHFLEGGFTFQWGWVLFFRWEGFIFKWVGAPWGYWFWWEGGSKKKVAWGGTLHHHHHHHGKSCIKRDNMSMDFIRKSIWIMIYQIGLPKVYFKVNYIWLSLK